jgi:hypothetical protein
MERGSGATKQNEARNRFSPSLRKRRLGGESNKKREKDKMKSPHPPASAPVYHRLLRKVMKLIATGAEQNGEGARLAVKKFQSN